VDQVLLHVEAEDLLGVVALADLRAVDPDGEGVVRGDVEGALVHHLLHRAVDLEDLAEVARLGRGLPGRVALVEPDPLHRRRRLGPGVAGAADRGNQHDQQPHGCGNPSA
jgi:hypothetical protein